MDPWGGRAAPKRVGLGLVRPSSSVVPVSPSTGTPSRRTYTAGSSTLGGTSSAAEARRAQEIMQEEKLALHREKLREREMIKLNEKIARYSHLNTAPGHKLGPAVSTLEEARQTQFERNSEIVSTLKLREPQCDVPAMTPQNSNSEKAIDNDTLLREMRQRQQERYNATMKKPCTL